jgi:hypothetical protein
MKINKEIFDVIVIGGGPAGIMSAIRAGELGAKTLLLEKNNKLGNKLLLTGGKRSNITKAEYNLREFVQKYGKEGDFLLYALSVFGPKETIEFFEKRGLKTKIEKDNKIFPESNQAKDVLSVLTKALKENNVLVMFNSKIEKITKAKNLISNIILENGQKISAKNYIMCTGGVSWPSTGSTGDGYKWAEELGHNIEKPRPALVPIKIKEEWVKKLQGLSLGDAELIVFQNNKRKHKVLGEFIFTHFGLSGPIILGISKTIGELLKSGEVRIILDLKPNLNLQSLDKEVQLIFQKNINKTFKNCLLDLVPTKIVPVIIELSGIDNSKKVNEITRMQRQGLAKLLKNLEMTVDSLLGFEEAIITSGGILLKEIDSKTMKSKIIENLYFAGEIINLDGPTGGYNLQLCWSTGYLAGQSAVNKKED